MFKTIKAVVVLVWYLISSRKELKLVKKLDEAGDVEGRDSYVVPRVLSWGKMCINKLGSTVEVHGEENIPQDTAVVFIANHQGLMDIPLLLGFIEKSKAFVAKIEILKVPVLSGWMKMMQCTFLDRKDRRQSVEAMAKATEKIKEGYSLVIFPEGTRSRGGPVAEFKQGSFKLAFRSGVPIVPVTIDGTWRMYEEKKHFASTHIKLTIHPAIPTAGLSREEQGLIPPQVQKIVESALTPDSFRK